MDVKTSTIQKTIVGTVKDSKSGKEGITKVNYTQNKNSGEVGTSKTSAKVRDEKADKRQYIPGYTTQDYVYPYNAAGTLMNTANFINEENTPVHVLQIKDLTIKDGVIRNSNILEGK